MNTGNIKRSFGKSRKLDNVCYDVRGPVLEEADRMLAQGVEVLRLNIGNPAPFGFHASEKLIGEMEANLRSAEGYSDSRGLLEARLAIQEYCRFKDIPNVDVRDIYTGNGVSELIGIAMQALLNQGDEMLIPAPDYPLWTASVTLAGGNAVHYICDERSGWYPDVKDMERKITSRTKGIVVINPNNPTGALYPKEVLKEIVELARRHGLILFADEIYDRLVMDGLEHTSVASLAPDLFVVSFNGLSKSHMIAGFRCGWMCLGGDKSSVGGYIEGINMLASMRLCSNVPSQTVIKTALENREETEKLLVPGGRIYEQREFIVKALGDIPGISVTRPQAAFYVFPKIDAKRFNITDDEKFVYDFLHDQRVLVVHGRGFNWKDPDHFRAVYLPKVEDLRLATEKLAIFLETYRQD